ncbi:hypothetical protein BDZ89DRAFT_958629 [Hymenopellis radicata]|nr:hypothetical protein BDZ89DRAFT_958629 [Hymenopellis radicata]
MTRSAPVDRKTRLLAGNNFREGFQERRLEYGNGGEDFLTNWLQTLADIGERPHMQAVVAEGGLYAWIMARWMGFGYWERNLQGPSPVLTHHVLGVSNSREIDRGTQTIREKITQSEKNMIVGLVEVNKDKETKSLYPTTPLLEEAWFYKSKIWNRTCDKVMNHISELIEKREWEPKSHNEWRRFLRSLAMREDYQMEYVPTEKDLRYGERMVKAAFPHEWNGSKIKDILIPERFAGLTHK